MTAPWQPRALRNWFEAAAHGGGGKGGGSQSTTSSTRVEYSPQEEARRQQIFNTGEGLYNAMAPGISTYRGPVPVGFDPATLAAQGLNAFNAAQFQSLTPAVAESANFALTGAKDVNSNPYLAEAMRAAIRPQVQTFTDTTLPALRMGGVASNTLGSSRQGVAEGLAAGRLQDSIAGTVAQMGSRGYESGLDASLQGLRALPSIGQGMSMPASMLSSVGAQRENLAQEVANYEAAGRTAEVNQPWELLQAYAALLQGMSNPITTSTGTVPRAGISPMQGIGAGLSAIGTIAPLIAKCWIARLVYGPDNPRWVAFRLWLELHPLLSWAYGKWGQQVARWLAPRPRIQALVRRAMNLVTDEVCHGLP